MLLSLGPTSIWPTVDSRQRISDVVTFCHEVVRRPNIGPQFLRLSMSGIYTPGSFRHMKSLMRHGTQVPVWLAMICIHLFKELMLLLI
jgi:hypothetical protein